MIVIVSDTHENLPAIDIAVQLIKELQPELVIHCGDIISPPVLKRFSELPMRCVYGNNDGERKGLQRVAEELGFPAIQDELEIQYNGKSIFVNHGTNHMYLDSQIHSGRFDYVFSGHTHQHSDQHFGKTRAINPGALFLCDPYTFALLDPQNDKVEFIEVKL